MTTLDLSYLTEIEGDVLSEWRERSRLTLYQTDPEAWLWDRLRRRWWSKQQEIAQSFVVNTKTLVKSCNGVGKTKLAADLVCWFISVFPPEETRVLLSAPIREQINTNMFNYLRENYQAAKLLDNPFIGEITKAPLWIVGEPFDKHIVIPKRPADENLTSSFQGVHDKNVAVVLDEAGGLPEELLGPAVDAVTTNEHARIFGIGNPDKLGTGFHNRFTDRITFSDWHLFTIGFDDTPNHTGEVIDPDDAENDRHIKSMLTQQSWADMMRRSAPAAVIAAKVDGEFPGVDDTTFFDAEVQQKAYDIEIDPDENAPIWLGCDLAFSGEDKSVIYVNVGGRVRLYKEWNKGSEIEHMEAARMIHAAAIDTGADEVRVDKSGIGAGVHSNLRSMPEFDDRNYTLIGVNGANSSPNKEIWLNARAWHYAMMRKGMADGLIDLDYADKPLREQMTIQPYEITLRSQIKITSKREMRSQNIPSPDHLDAAVYSVIPFASLMDGPAGDLVPGEQLHLDPWELADLDLYGMPV